MNILESLKGENEMKVLELFAGTRSIGKAFEAQGHEVFSVEWDRQHENIDLYIDISKLTPEMVLEKFGKTRYYLGFT